MNYKRLVFLLFVLGTFSCEKEKDFQVYIQHAQKTSFAINSLYEIVENAMDIFSYNVDVANDRHTLLSKNAKVQFNDYIFWDGNGIGFSLNYGNTPSGSKTFQGRYKSGSFNARMTYEYNYKETSITITINKPDRLFVYKELSATDRIPYQVVGKIVIERWQGDWFYTFENCTLTGNNEVIGVDLGGRLVVSEGGDYGLKDDAMSLEINGEMVIAGEPIRVHTSNGIWFEKDFANDCSRNFYKGILRFGNEGSYLLDWDVYSDGACDGFAKLRWKHKEELISLP